MSDDAAPLIWTSWPVRERPGAGVLGGVVVLGLGALAAVLVSHWLAGAATVVAFCIALHRFYLPVRCSIDGERARVRTVLGERSMPVASVRRVSHDERAILLQSRSTATSLDIARGLLMPLPMREHDRLLQAVLARIGGVRS